MIFNTKTVSDLSKFVNTCQDGCVSLPTTIEATACCVPRVTAAPTVEDAERVARVFKALGDPTRVRLLSLIAAGTGGEACICDLTEPVGLSQGTVSHHMKLLADAGLVTREQRGKWAYFALNADAMDAAADALRMTAPRS
jgi:ArsR family transcriptional regulator